MRSIFSRGILAATAALTAACSSTDSVAPATAPASARRTVSAGAEGVTTLSRPIDQNVWVSCANGGAGEAQIQRVNTVGGVAPSTAGSVVGEIAEVPYTAEYFFYRGR